MRRGTPIRVVIAFAIGLFASCGDDFNFRPSGVSRQFTDPERPLYATATPEPTPAAAPSGG